MKEEREFVNQSHYFRVYIARERERENENAKTVLFVRRMVEQTQLIRTFFSIRCRRFWMGGEASGG